MWLFADLRKIEDIVSAQYKRALELGIYEGLARQFRKDIYAFKSE
jgi:hypothetical protein